MYCSQTVYTSSELLDQDPSLVSLMKSKGLSIETIEHYEMLEKLRKKQPSLIILPITEASYDNLDFCKRLTSTYHNSHLQVLIIDYTRQKDLYGEAYNAGCSNYIRSSYTFVEKIELITSMVSVEDDRNHLSISGF